MHVSLSKARWCVSKQSSDSTNCKAHKLNNESAIYPSTLEQTSWILQRNWTVVKSRSPREHQLASYIEPTMVDWKAPYNRSTASKSWSPAISTSLCKLLSNLFAHEVSISLATFPRNFLIDPWWYRLTCALSVFSVEYNSLQQQRHLAPLVMYAADSDTLELLTGLKHTPSF